MIHLPHLIIDLGLILAAAGVTTLIFKKIRQPLVLGYIIAGVLVGPHILFTPTVGNSEDISIWAEIGVIFLLFSLGLEFSFKKLIRVGGSASITAIVEVVCMLGIGYITGQAFGWSTMDSIFLGGILSISSTTIIIRAFEELGVKTQRFATVVFGVLVIEDLVAIVLLVLLSTVAVSQQFAGQEMLVSVLKLSFFLVLWFLAGIFLLPTFLKRTRGLMNDETLLIVSLGLCLLMVVLATEAGFSPALGAFIMGSILAETTQAERIEHLIKSVKDLFGAVFFVSVGMLIDPEMIVKHAGAVIAISLVTIVGKFVSSAIGALLSGQSLKTAIQAGMSLAQIGEFSFIIATLGLTLNVTGEFLYPIAVAVSALTTFTTPYLIRLSEPLYEWLEPRLPARWTAGLNRYQSDAQVIVTLSDWKKVLRSYIFTVIIHGVLLLSILLLSTTFLAPFIAEHIANGLRGQLITSGITFLLMAPFLWALAVRRVQRKAYSTLWLEKKYSRGPLVILELSRIALAVLFVVLSVYQLLSSWIALIIVLLLAAVVILLFSKRLQAVYGRIERRFIDNFNERERAAAEDAGPQEHIVPWDAHIAHFTVTPESPVAGRSLIDLGVREKFGVSIALIERGKLTIAAPGGEEKLYPGDRLALIGTDEQFGQIKPVIEHTVEHDIREKQNIGLHRIRVEEHSPLVGKSIRESAIREKAAALVVGLEREGNRILNPDSSTVFRKGDIVWIAGISGDIQKLAGR